LFSCSRSESICSFAASTVILAATLATPGVSVTLAVATIWDFPTLFRAVSFTIGATPGVSATLLQQSEMLLQSETLLLHSQLIPLVDWQQVFDWLSSVYREQRLDLLHQDILFLNCFKKRSVKSCLKGQHLLSQDYLVLPLLLQ